MTAHHASNPEEPGFCQTKKRTRTWEEEVEWRQLSWLPDFADTSRAWARAFEDASMELPINIRFHQALNHEANAEREHQQRARLPRRD